MEVLTIVKKLIDSFAKDFLFGILMSYGDSF